MSAMPQPIKGRCGTCDWPTDRLPCPYCAAVRREQQKAPDATAGDGLRERAERIVANWRVNFDHDDDRPLVNMIETALRALDPS